MHSTILIPILSKPTLYILKCGFFLLPFGTAPLVLASTSKISWKVGMQD